VCASTYVNGNRRKFFEKNFSTLPRLDDPRNKPKITAPSPVHPPASYPNVATAKRLDNEDKGRRCHLHDHNLTATRNSEKNVSAPAEKKPYKVRPAEFLLRTADDSTIPGEAVYLVASAGEIFSSSLNMRFWSDEGPMEIALLFLLSEEAKPLALRWKEADFSITPTVLPK